MSDQSAINSNLSVLIQVQTSKPARDLSSSRQSTFSADGTLSKDDQKAIDAAEKFEALLIHNMLKSMRKTTMSENTSNQRAIYDDMLDEKLADTMIQAGGLGVAKQILSQIQASTQTNTQATSVNPEESTPQTNSKLNVTSMSPTQQSNTTNSKSNQANTDQIRLREIAKSFNGTTASAEHIPGSQKPLSAQALQHTPESGPGLSSTDVTRLRMASELWDKEQDYNTVVRQQQFLEPLIPHAKRNAERLGTSHEAILAIAALETGWGQSMIKNELGQSTNNLFGIKATSRDKGFTSNMTTEFINGRAEKIEARFRTYKSSADAVDGFANFVLENPRYSNALKHAGNPERFLQELQSAGYATDPNYAEKAISVMRQIKSHPLPL